MTCHGLLSQMSQLSRLQPFTRNQGVPAYQCHMSIHQKGHFTLLIVPSVLRVICVFLCVLGPLCTFPFHD